MFKSFKGLFQNPTTRTASGRDGAIFVETNVSIFDHMDGHLAELLAAETAAKAAHNKILQDIRDYKANLKARYENQLQSIQELIAE